MQQGHELFVVVELERVDLVDAGAQVVVHSLVGVVEVERAARHSRGEVAPDVAEDDHHAAGHVLAGVVAGALDDDGGARVAHRAPFADDAARRRSRRSWRRNRSRCPR